jgi:hypothetical protein
VARLPAAVGLDRPGHDAREPGHHRRHARPPRAAGGYRATFTGAVLEYAYTAGFTGQPSAPTLVEHTERGRRDLELPTVDTYAAAAINHVLDCLHGRATNHIAPASVLDTLGLTLDIHYQ